METHATQPTSHTDESILEKSLNTIRQTIIPGSKYYHHKNPNLFYKVIDICLNEADEKPYVIYLALYGKNLLWTRSFEKWCENVVHDGKLTPRFIRCDPENDS
jgi:hypothetical protein